jgi:hypothetical protein
MLKQGTGDYSRLKSMLLCEAGGFACGVSAGSKPQRASGTNQEVQGAFHTYAPGLKSTPTVLGASSAWPRTSEAVGMCRSPELAIRYEWVAMNKDHHVINASSSGFPSRLPALRRPSGILHYPSENGIREMTLRLWLDMLELWKPLSNILIVHACCTGITANCP